MTSIAGRALMSAIRHTGAKESCATAAGLRLTLARRPDGRAQPPAWLSRVCAVARSDVAGHPSYTFTPRGCGGQAHEVLYLHGGAYVHDAVGAHWLLVARLVRALGCRVTFLVYPLAPEHTHRAAHAMALESYAQLLARAPASRITVMGDSAGGGFCLALCQLARAAGLPQPAHAILLSPWLDLTMTAAGLDAVDGLDPVLGIAGLVEAGLLWAGDTPVNDPLLSPLHADVADLAPIAIFFGTSDLLVLDARRLRDRMRAEGVPLRYFEYPGMFHAFATYPIPEGVRVMRRIKEILGG